MSDPLWSNVALQLHFDGANGSTTFTDETGKTVTAAGSVQISTAQSKFGGASGYFDGGGAYLSVPTSTDFDLGSTYTVEFWINPATLTGNRGILHRGYYTVGGSSWAGLTFSIRWVGSFCRFYFYGTSVANEQYIDVSGAFVVGEWRHVAMVRDGTAGRVYINGVLAGSISGLNTNAPSTQALRIGLWDFSAGAEYFSGYLDDLRLVKGEALYASNFTPPTGPFPGETGPLIDGLLSGQLLPSGASVIQVSNPTLITAEMSGQLLPSDASFIDVFNPVEIDGLLSGRLAPSPYSRILVSSFLSENVYLTVVAELKFVSLEIKPVRVDGQLGLSGAIGTTSRQSLVVDGSLRLVNDTPCGCVNG